MLLRAAITTLLFAASLAAQPAGAGAPALHVAVEEDDRERVAALLAGGADPKAVNSHGVVPLTIACANGSAPIVELLLTAGADPNTASAEGETALMLASRSGSREAVKLLLARGAEVNRKESWRGQTALMWAAAEGHTTVVDLLLEFSADLRARSVSGFTPLLFAVREGRAETVARLIKAGADANDALPARIRRAAGASTTEANSLRAGLSALHLAVANCHFALAAQLLDAGANPNAAGPGWTPLHTLSWARKPGTGSNDPAPPGSGSMDSLALVRKFAAKGAYLNARMTVRFNAGLSALNTIGATPFLMAARCADADYMRLLAELGADPRMPTSAGSTPLMVAAGLGTRSPGEDAGADAEVVEAIGVALALGNEIDAVDSNGETAMHGAAYKNLPGAVFALAEKGAKVEVWNRPNRLGWTPLRIATGVHRTGNFRPSPPTAAAVRKIMESAGVSTALADNLDPKTVR
jgi:ankyrin repeat protein